MQPTYRNKTGKTYCRKDPNYLCHKVN